MIKRELKSSGLSLNWLTAVVLAVVFVSPAFADIYFQGLGDLPGGKYDSSAFGVSDDGSVVVGQSSVASGPDVTQEAFRWTPSGGMVGLGDLPGGSFHSRAHGVSGDGSVVVGDGSSASGAEGFRWTSGGGMVGLGDLPGGSFHSQVLDISSDGSVIVGGSTSTLGTEGFRWTSAGGIVALGDLPGGIHNSWAIGVSGDGSVVVGWGNSALGREACIWTSAGMVGLGDLSGGTYRSMARDVSADGSVVVGWGNSAFGREAFIWTSGGGMVGLGDLPGGSFHSRAYGVSGDGSVVVGDGRTALDTEAFIWDQTSGMRNLKDVLESDYGLDLTGWTLTRVFGISANGLSFVGGGINPAGYPEAWVATLPPLNVVPVAEADGPYLVAVNHTIMLDGSGSYDDDGDTLSYLWTQDYILGSFDNPASENPNYTGSKAGITDLTLTVSDGKADDSDTTLLVVYDPSGGFVTGGGWIYSELGAYKPDPSLEGKANFGFVSKYKKGATTPTGNTEFQFKTGDLNFHSSSYDWLVVNQAGTNAQFKGSGTINGEGDYRFMLWAGDDPDTFRIRIWEEDEISSVETDIYDNGFDQGIGSGSIVVHVK